jgi:apolipoprotein D and lipocalin family protein
VLAIVIGLAMAACHDDLEVAPDVDLQRFEGRWHEIAHLPRVTQKNCSGTVATYTRRDDGTLDVVHECTLGDGSYYGKTARATVPDPATPSKLAVDFGGYLGDYWIVEVAPDYRYAVVGHPSRSYLWILSRTPTLDEADRTAILAHAESKGFSTKRLEYTPQAAEPAGTPAPATPYGCTAVGAGGGGALPTSAPFAVVACFVGAAFRRRRRAT